MHSINKTFLNLALLPKSLYQRLGVNTMHLKSILTAKLTMDDRRPNTLHQTSRRASNKPVEAATVGTILVSALMGLIYLISFEIGKNTTTHLTFYFSFFFFMLAASLISDFTAVLIDVRDNYILLPKPVSDRTIVTARILHIFIHICKLVVPMCIPGFVYMVLHYGLLGGLYFLLMVLLLTLFVIFFINALYILVLRITTPTRFQAIISYVQIGFAIAIYASYQVIPHLANRSGVLNFDATAHRVLFIAPMYWCASGWNTLYTLHGNVWAWLLLLLAVATPVLSLYAVIKYLAPSFNNRLSLLNSVSLDVQKPVTKGKKRNTTSAYVRTASRLLTTGGAERMGFLFTSKMMSRSRDFKVKVYPSIGYMAVIAVMMFLGRRNTDLASLDAERTKSLLLSALYFSAIILITALNQLAQSDKFKASWLYFIVPLQKPGLVISGALKAVLLRFYVPVATLITIGALYVIGWSVLPNLVLGICNELLITALIVYGNNKVFPFSIQQNNNTRGGMFIKNMLLLAVSGIIGIGHYLVYNIMGAVLLFIALSALATWLLLSSIKDTSWHQIERAYTGPIG